MNAQRALIRAELDSVRSDLVETFPHLTDDLLPWAPTEGMRTVHGQFVEIISTERSLADRIGGGPQIPFQEREAPIWATSSVAGLTKLLEETRAATLELLDSISEGELGRVVEVHPGFAEYLRLDHVPVSELFRFIARHESYHAGQLVAYLWARGNDPYTWE